MLLYLWLLLLDSLIFLLLFNSVTIPKVIFNFLLLWYILMNLVFFLFWLGGFRLLFGSVSIPKVVFYFFSLPLLFFLFLFRLFFNRSFYFLFHLISLLLFLSLSNLLIDHFTYIFRLILRWAILFIYTIFIDLMRMLGLILFT